MGLPKLFDATLVGPVKVWMFIALVLFQSLKQLFTIIFTSSKKVTANHILVKDEKKCQELKSDILSKETLVEQEAKFFELAKKFSTCPSGKEGGSLGSFGPGAMVPEFDRVCWSAPVG